MDWSHAFGPPQPLSRFLADLDTLPDQWLYIPVGLEEIKAGTPCRAYIVDSSELSPEEDDELEEYPQTIGLQWFLCLSQLEEIMGNLREQRPSFSERELIAAIDYYWRNDAFIDRDGAA